MRTTAGRFRGVIAPMLAKSSLFRPVARHYRKSKPQFALVHTRQSHKAGDVAFTISPTIKLTCISRNTDHTDFHFDSTRIFQTLNVRPSSPRATAIRDRVRREFSFAERTHVRELLSSLFSTFRQTINGRTLHAKLQRQAQSHKESSHFFLSTFAPLREKTFVTHGAHNHFTSVSDLKFFSNRRTDFQTTDLQQHQHHNWLLLRSSNSQKTDESHVAQNTFTTLSLNFAAPNTSETELVQQRIAQFVSVPALTYAKPQKEMSENIVQALRELRTVEQEPQRVAAPVLPTIEQLTSQVKTQLERELRIERERRGL